MLMISQSMKKSVFSILEVYLSKWYPTLQEILKPSKGILAIFQNGWIPYLKSIECKVEVSGSSHQLSISPTVWYYPNISPFLSITTEDGKCVSFSDLFKVSEEIINILRSNEFEFSESSVRSATYELLLLALESRDGNLPSLDEIKRRIKDNLDKFLQRVLSNSEKVLSVAPIIGCKIDDTIEFDNGCILRTPTESDVFVMTMARGLDGYNTTLMEISPSEPVLVVEHEIITAIEQYKDVEIYIRELHESFKRKTCDILLALRLCTGEPVGYGLVYHIDRIWITPLSLRVITEEPHPNYKITTLYEIHGKRFDRRFLFNFSEKLVRKKDILDIYNRIDALYSKLDKCQDENEVERYSQLLLALKYYSKSMDEFEIGWSILCLTNALESICVYLGRRCSTGDQIKRTLKSCGLSLTNDEEKLIENAYRVRSEFIAHPGSKGTISKIDLITKNYFYLPT